MDEENKDLNEELNKKETELDKELNGDFSPIDEIDPEKPLEKPNLDDELGLNGNDEKNSGEKPEIDKSIEDIGPIHEEDDKEIDEEFNLPEVDGKDLDENELHDKGHVEDLGEQDISENRKDEQQKDSLDKTLVLDEIYKNLSSSDSIKENNLIRSMDTDINSLISKFCSKKALSEFKPGEEKIAGKSIFARMAYMGGVNSIAKRITTNPKYANIGLKEDDIKAISADEYEANKDVIDDAITDPSLNIDALKRTNVLLLIDKAETELLNMTDNPYIKQIVASLDKIKDDIYRNLDLMNTPRRTFPEDAIINLKTISEQVSKAKEEVLEVKAELDPDQDMKSVDVKDVGDNKAEFYNSKPLEKVVDDSVNYANEKEGSSADRAGAKIAEEVEKDVRGKEELAQEESNRQYAEKQSELDEHNDRNDKGQR